MIDLKKTKMMIREMKADHIFSKSEATQLSILVDRVKDGRDDLAIMLAQSLATEITEFPAGSPGLEPREECGLSKFFNLGANAAKPCT